MTSLALALAAGAAGGVGSAVRHLVDRAVPWRDRVPWALLVINSVGSFALGVLVGATAEHTWHAVVGTGLLGGFTTFSSASLDAAVRWLDGERGASVRSALVMVVVCVLAASLGVAIG